MATTLHIVEACRKTTPRRRDEPLEQYLARLTHLNLSQRHLSAVGDIAHCHRLMVLYLYQNNLSQLRGLRSCAHLTQLYLQDNALERLDGLSTLTHLTKLYIGGNRLVVLEGLHNLHKLRELHAERQELPPGEELILDPRSLRTAQRQLEVLNLEHNGLTSLHSLHGFQKLRTLRLGGNHLAHLHELRPVLAGNRHLHTLTLHGNPFCEMNKWREEIIIMSHALKDLDGREITAMQRTFLENWKRAIEQGRARSKQARGGSHRRHRPQDISSAASTMSRRSSRTRSHRGASHKPPLRMPSKLRPPSKPFFLPPIEGRSSGSAGNLLTPTGRALPTARFASTT